MLTALLPGLRELRAPLASGYVLLAALWVALDPSLPTAPELRDQNGPLASLYELEPYFGTVAVPVVVSIAAYLTGSIFVQFLTWLLSPGLMRLLRARLQPLQVSPTNKAVRFVEKLLLGEQGPSFRTTSEGLALLRARIAERDDDERAVDEATMSARGWLEANRTLVKMHLLDVNPALHSEVDRPDAEANFRTSLGSALIVFALALSLKTDASAWIIAMVVAGCLLALHGLMLQHQANDLLLAALATKPDLSELLDRALGSSSNRPHESGSATVPASRAARSEGANHRPARAARDLPERTHDGD